MSNVLIRDVPEDDLEQIRTAAAERGTSLQRYLRDAVSAQAVYLRRQAALARTTQRLENRAEVPADERRAVRGAIDASHRERSERLGGSQR